LVQNVIIALLALTALYVVFKVWADAWLYNIRMPLYAGYLTTVDWSILAALFALAVTAMFMRRASKALVAFLSLVPLTMLTVRYIQPFRWSPVSAELPLALLIGGLVALALADTERFISRKLRAAIVLLGGSALLWFWCWRGLSFISREFDSVFVFEANYPILAAAIARFVLLAYIPAVLFAAWWLISPKEIESLVLGKQDTSSESDGDVTNIPGT
jgi:hypothetical protein